jgi:DNA-binding IscR family transcriptional regulator
MTVYVLNVRAVWSRVLEAQQAVLKETTLADLLGQSEGLQYVI